MAAAPKSYEHLYRGVRYLLLKGSERIQDATAARAKLDRLLEVNTNLNIAYILKEELRELWSCVSRQDAARYLYNWFQKAWSSGITLLQNFAEKLAVHRTGILNYLYHPITTGKVEAINNKIKVLKRRGYGYRNMEYFTLRIYFLHESRYALVG